MSRFFSEKYRFLEPYTPGEQPKNTEYIKLNTNESPFPPSERAQKYAAEAAQMLQLYSDPTCSALHEKIARNLGVASDEVLATNGSDEILNFAFMAFCDTEHPAVFADITYGFYKVFAEINSVPYTEIPLKDDFSVEIDDYTGVGKTVFIANPNAPTGIALKRSEIERIIESNPNNIVVVDEAYVDFGADSCVPLIKKYDNLLVTQTFSKSRSMAGARLGFGVACKELISDLNAIKYSTNPYNINRMTMAAGIGALEDDEYMRKNCGVIAENREYAAEELKKLGFSMTVSSANFLFAKHGGISGANVYLELKKRGILVRHFEDRRICDYNRITIGSHSEMEALVKALKDITEEYCDEKN